jgi:hypothetical protein
MSREAEPRPHRLAEGPPSAEPTEDRARALFRALQAPPRLDAGSSVRLDRRVGELARSGASRRSRWMLAVLPAAVAMATVAIFARSPSDDGVKGAIHARGPRHEATTAGQASSPALLVFHIGADGRSQPLGETVRSDDELAFAYRSDGMEHKLLVFGRDERGTIYWYHPAWTDPATNPEAIVTSREPGVHELPAAIAHPLPMDHIEICSIFTTNSLRVREAEAALVRGELQPDCRKVTVAR